jgi:hypothetical protein
VAANETHSSAGLVRPGRDTWMSVLGARDVPFRDLTIGTRRALTRLPAARIQ